MVGYYTGSTTMWGMVWCVMYDMFQLFDHIAECLCNFMKENQVETEKLPLGFTFSFPLKQEGLTQARLVTWTKGFNCAGVEGEDVVRLLQEAIRRRGVSFKYLIIFLVSGAEGINLPVIDFVLFIFLIYIKFKITYSAQVLEIVKSNRVDL